MKKGISPLLATVMLIGFVIVMATVAFQWYTKNIEDQTGETENLIEKNIKCSSDIQFQIRNVEHPPQDTTFIIENQGSVTIDKIKVVVDGIPETGFRDANIEPSGASQFSVNNPSKLKITVHPAILSNNEISVCQGYSKTIDPSLI